MSGPWGAAGPPSRHDLTQAFYNNVGLLTGLFIVFLGFAALKEVLHTEKRGALAAVGLASFSYVIWIIECLLMWVQFITPATLLPKAQQPEWYLALLFVYHWIDSLRLGSVYLASAAFVLAGLLIGRINRWGGWLLLIFR